MSADELIALAERVEAATGADRELDEAIRLALGRERVLLGVGDGLCATDEDYEAELFTASLDAAMTLVPEGWDWTWNGAFRRAWVFGRETESPYPSSKGGVATPALALTAACLRARAALEGQPS